MLKFKDPKKKFSIVYQSENMTEHNVYDYLLTEKEVNLLTDNADVFVLDSNTDIDEWEAMSGLYERGDFTDYAKDFGMDKFFTFE